MLKAKLHGVNCSEVDTDCSCNNLKGQYILCTCIATFKEDYSHSPWGNPATTTAIRNWRIINCIILGLFANIPLEGPTQSLIAIRTATLFFLALLATNFMVQPFMFATLHLKSLICLGVIAETTPGKGLFLYLSATLFGKNTQLTCLSNSYFGSRFNLLISGICLTSSSHLK